MPTTGIEPISAAAAMCPDQPTEISEQPTQANLMGQTLPLQSMLVCGQTHQYAWGMVMWLGMWLGCVMALMVAMV